MIKKRFTSLAVTTALLCLLPLQASERLRSSLIIETPKEEEIKEIQEPEAPEAPPTIKKWVADNLTPNEQLALDFFQEYGITDRAALATILGNIKQESRFHSNICEGGARVDYESCHRGGYGLIQWTTVGRYDGLGRHARSIGGNPSQIDTQLSYLVTEREWKEALWRFKTPDKSLDFYMKGAYRWLGWGIHGSRSQYAQQYYEQLRWA